MLKGSSAKCMGSSICSQSNIAAAVS